MRNIFNIYLLLMSITLILISCDNNSSSSDSDEEKAVIFNIYIDNINTIIGKKLYLNGYVSDADLMNDLPVAYIKETIETNQISGYVYSIDESGNRTNDIVTKLNGFYDIFIYIDYNDNSIYGDEGDYLLDIWKYYIDTEKNNPISTGIDFEDFDLID